MKRSLLLALAGVALLVSIVIVTASHASGYQVAAVFDDADQIVPGSQVKIAGAVVGSVQAVQLRPGPTARIVMSVPARFRPFHADASCSILPEGLISENFVQCTPGTSTAPLPAGLGGVPTVPIAHTTIPLSLQQLIDVFTVPTDERISLMLDELGIATSGRGQDLNALLLRSNPALTQARRALGILARQRQELANGIVESNQVLAALAQSRQSVREFVDNAAAASEISAAHAPALAAGIQHFPALLGVLRSALARLREAAVAGLPVLTALHEAAPQLSELNTTLPPFLRAGTASLPSLTALSRTTLSTIRVSHRTVADLLAAARHVPGFARDTDATLISVRNGGGNEAFLRLNYSVAAALAGYDSLSHVEAAYINVFPQCMNHPPAAACVMTYDSPGEGTIPANDPACGPQSAAPWAPATDCVAENQTGAIRHHRRTSHRHGSQALPSGRRGATPTPAPGTSPVPGAGDHGLGGVVSAINKLIQKVGGGTAPSTPAPTSHAELGPLLRYLLAP